MNKILSLNDSPFTDSCDIPMTVYQDNGKISSNINIILGKWSDDFSKPLNANTERCNFAEKLYSDIIKEKERLEAREINGVGNFD